MFVYGKEASNRKQEIDRQHHKRKETLMPAMLGTTINETS